MPLSSRSTCLLVVLSAVGAHADEAQKSQDTVLKKVVVRANEDAELGLTKPTTAGSRLELTGLQTPASIDVISSEIIRKRGQNSVAQAVTQNGVGFTINSPAIFGSGFAARGFTGNNSIMQLYDGTRLYLGTGNVTYPFDTWTVDRIEILHGPASVLYGEGAIGGVVNVISKKPATDAIHNEIQVSAGSYDTYGLALDSTGPLSDTVSYRISGSGRKSEGWVDLGESSSKTFAGSLRWQATSDLALTFSSDYGDQRPMAYFGTPLINGHLDKSLRDENYNIKNHRIQFKDSWNQLKAEWTPSENLEFHNTLYQLHSSRQWRNAEVYAQDENDPNLIARSEYIQIKQSQNQIGDRMDATLKSRVAGADNTLVLGLDINRADFGYSNNFFPAGTGGAFDVGSTVPFQDFDHGYFTALPANKLYDSKVKQRSVFIEDRIAWSKQWSTVAGLRYDHIEVERDGRRDPTDSLKRTFDPISWRIGTVYNPIPTLAIYAQYATAADPVGPLLQMDASKKQFDLATGKQWEVGVKQSFAEGRGEWTVSVFDIVKRKLLVMNPSTFQYDQIGQQSSRGIELALAMDLGAGWSIDANATWLRAKYDDFSGVDINWDTFEISKVSYNGNVPILAPERSGNLWLSWNFLPQWNARLGTQYVGKSHYDYANTQVIDAYTVVHASLEWQPVDSTTLSLQVHNLFDRVYAETWHSENQWFLGQPRTVEVVARMKF